MLTELTISNFALIDHLEVNFSNGMSSITGETGAGKSILLGGLALVLGKRADLSTLKDKSKKCFIDATFSIGAYNLAPFFAEMDIDYESITTIRREIIPSGKSRAFINDTPVSIAILQQLGDQLIDIHSQHQTLSLTEEEYQLEVLDALADNSDTLKEYKGHLVEFKETTRAHEELLAQKQSLEEESDYHRFLLEELSAIKMEEGMMEELEEEIRSLSNVEEIETLFSKSLQIIEEEQMGVQVQLNEVRSALQKLSGMKGRYEELHNRLESLLIELNDLTSEINLENEQLVANPQRLEELNAQYQTLNNLLSKHQVRTLTELIQKRDCLDQKVIQTASLDEQLQRLSEKRDTLSSSLEKLAQTLSDHRKEAIPTFINQMTQLLGLLGMPNARFQINLVPTSQFLSSGKEKLDFTFSANQGSDFGSLKKVASGGELSRIMLSVKAILSEFKTLPTIIFDEIDTGVSGEVGYKIADIMHHMANYMQVITITHLPQVAAKGAHHFKVFKETKGESTFTQLNKLNPEERITEVAQMLSGDSLSNTALQHARELLN